MFGSQWSLQKKIVVGLVVLVLSSLVIVAPFLFWQLHEASDSLHAFGDALIAKDYQKAYKQTDPVFQEFSSFDTFLKAHQGLDVRLGNLKSVSWSTMSVNRRKDYWYATADVWLEFERATVPFTFVMKKNGKWRVYSYHEK